MTDFRELSRRGWEGNGTVEHINAGSLQRIADATEKMAESYIRLINDRDYQKRRAENEIACSQRLMRSNASLRGHVRRLRRKVAANG